MKIGGLFEGYGGLTMAAQLALGAGDLAWHSEIEPGPCKILGHHYPGVPNLGDITAIDWANVEPVDVICGGSPCQDVSAAGKRAGMRAGTRSGLWESMREGIAILRPRLVIWENVRGATSACAHSDLADCPRCVGSSDRSHEPVLRALGRVLGDLADLGFDAEWHGLRAADVGAPHGRFRIFVVARDAAQGGWRRGSNVFVRQGERDAERGTVPTTDAAGDGRHARRPESARIVGRSDAALGGDAPTSDADRDGCEVVGRLDAERHDTDRCGGQDVAWGAYEPAIRRESSGIATQSDQRTAILGRDENLPGERVSEPDSCAGLVQEALHTLEGDGRPASDQDGRPDTAASDRPVLGNGQQDADVLAVDWSGGKHLRARQVHGPGQELEGSPLGLSGTRRVDSGRTDARPSLPSASLRESSAPGAGIPCGERAAGERGQDALPAGTPTERDQSVPQSAELAGVSGVQERSESTTPQAIDWGKYAPAIERWQRTLGRVAPAPTETGPKGGQRLSPKFVEWMMGLSAGHVTDPAIGLTRNEQLKALGNGVVPQQGAAAIRVCLARFAASEVAA